MTSFAKTSYVPTYWTTSPRRRQPVHFLTLAISISHSLSPTQTQCLLGKVSGVNNVKIFSIKEASHLHLCKGLTRYQTKHRFYQLFTGLLNLLIPCTCLQLECATLHFPTILYICLSVFPPLNIVKISIEPQPLLFPGLSHPRRRKMGAWVMLGFVRQAASCRKWLQDYTIWTVRHRLTSFCSQKYSISSVTRLLNYF